MDHYITVTCGMSGFYAVLVSIYDGPVMTGVGRYSLRAEAEEEARDWATAEELQYRGPEELTARRN